MYLLVALDNLKFKRISFLVEFFLSFGLFKISFFSERIKFELVSFLGFGEFDETLLGEHRIGVLLSLLEHILIGVRFQLRFEFGDFLIRSRKLKVRRVLEFRNLSLVFLLYLHEHFRNRLLSLGLLVLSLFLQMREGLLEFLLCFDQILLGLFLLLLKEAELAFPKNFVSFVRSVQFMLFIVQKNIQRFQLFYFLNKDFLFMRSELASLRQLILQLLSFNQVLFIGFSDLSF